MIFELLGPDNERWSRALEGVSHEFYHLPGYAVLEADRMGGTAAALFVQDSREILLIPLVLRPIGLPGCEGIVDAISPYGYPGPIVVGDPAQRSSFIQHAMATALPELAKHGVVSAFVRLNPLANSVEDFRGIGHVVEHSFTVWIDLTLSQEDLQRHVRSRFRSNVNAILRDGVTVRFDDDGDSLDTFVSLYHRTMDRVGAAPWYYFDRAYFEKFARVLGDQLKLCVVEDRAGVVAAGMFGVSGGVVQYLFSGSDDDQRQPHATKLMLVFVRDWAKRMGHRKMQLGGGLGSTDDSLRWFKRGFSKLSATFCTWRIVCDESLYRKAVAQWEMEIGERADDVAGFFPAYRKTTT